MPGYIMIDMGGVNLSIGSAQVRAGMYNKLKSCIDIDKPIYLVNCNTSGSKNTPIQATAWDAGDGVTMYGNDYMFEVSKTDRVVVTFIGNYIEPALDVVD